MPAVNMRRVALFASLLIGAVIVFATLSPVKDRPRLPLPVDLERGLAFAALAFFLSLGFGRACHLILAGCVLMAAGLEWMQTLLPSRHGQMHDFEIKAFGSLAGLVIAVIVTRLVHTLSPS